MSPDTEYDKMYRHGVHHYRSLANGHSHRDAIVATVAMLINAYPDSVDRQRAIANVREDMAASSNCVPAPRKPQEDERLQR